MIRALRRLVAVHLFSWAIALDQPYMSDEALDALEEFIDLQVRNIRAEDLGTAQ